MKKLIFINSHPIQYFAPLYQYLVQQNFDMEVWYCSDESIKGEIDKEFGVKVKWDIPLLSGYKNKFFKNYAFNKGVHQGFFGLFNLGLVPAILKEPKCIFVVHGWKYFSDILSLFTAKIKGHKVALRAEMPYNQEVLKTGITQNVKIWVLKYLLFKCVDYFLYLGEQNKKYYLFLGISEDRLIKMPYAVDNNRFREAADQLRPQKNSLRNKLNIPLNAFVILFSGKYIQKKRPLDLLKSFKQLDNSNAFLIMMGDGELRNEMESYITEYNVKNILLTGFINQSSVLDYYAVSNIFVMCSGSGETWGLSVNEAMNFDLPLVISDMTGCTSDLLVEGENGFVFQTGNIDDLTCKLAYCINNPTFIYYSGKKSHKIINNFSYKEIEIALMKLVEC